MLPRTYLIDRIGYYADICNQTARRPTYSGLSAVLGCCPQTVANVVHGKRSDGIAYGDHPSCNRVIANSDFAVVRTVFAVNIE